MVADWKARAHLDSQAAHAGEVEVREVVVAAHGHQGRHLEDLSSAQQLRRHRVAGRGQAAVQKQRVEGRERRRVVLAVRQELHNVEQRPYAAQGLAHGAVNGHGLVRDAREVLEAVVHLQQHVGADQGAGGVGADAG